MGCNIFKLLIAINPAFSAEQLSALQLRDFKYRCQALMCSLSQAVTGLRFKLSGLPNKYEKITVTTTRDVKSLDTISYSHV